jgi:hypothetical protein
MDPSDPDTFDMGHRYCAVEGEVTQVFFPRRDRAVLAFPSFEFRGDVAGGMSGGPIFNDRKQVCGVISGSGSIPGVSYGAVLWPVLGVPIDGGRLLDFARQGRIRAINHHCVTIHAVSGFEFPGMSFDPNIDHE